jgi:hypothetical protein
MIVLGQIAKTTFHALTLLNSTTPTSRLLPERPLLLERQPERNAFFLSVLFVRVKSIATESGKRHSTELFG